MTASKAQLTLRIRTHVHSLVVDASNVEPVDVAIYTLSDPRNIREARYIGQTSCPGRRYLQHINQAKLWMPAETPWWIKTSGLRPLYQWIRELYADDSRLPVMMILAWTERCNALSEEQRYIAEFRSALMPLLNFFADSAR